MNKKQVVQVPKDTVLSGVIINVEKTTWEKIISPDKISRFENPQDEIVHITYEVQYENRTLKGDETFNYYDAPMANSKLGMFLEKYDDLKAGIQIKIDYNAEGHPSIRLK